MRALRFFVLCFIQLRSGDCLDFSNFLASLLRGCGYDAYVVSGYAPEWICVQDQSKTECPLAVDRGPNSDSDNDTSPDAEKYKILQLPDNKSKYHALLKKEEKERHDAEMAARRRKLKFTHDDKVDPLQGNRVHCWVLVKKGARDVKEHLYVEPSTGVVYSQSNSPYLGVESVWNEKNYWVNVDENSTPQTLELDLR